MAAEEIGIDPAFVRLHVFARQLASPFPLLAAMGARTSRIELATAVIDMRYENPLYMAEEEAAATDRISGGRSQLGISRGSPEPAVRGYESFGYRAPEAEGHTDGDMARSRTALFRAAIAGAGVAQSDPQMIGSEAPLAIQPQSLGLADRIWRGSPRGRHRPAHGCESAPGRVQGSPVGDDRAACRPGDRLEATGRARGCLTALCRCRA